MMGGEVYLSVIEKKNGSNKALFCQIDRFFPKWRFLAYDVIMTSSVSILLV